MNSVYLIGRSGADAEIKQTNSGFAVANVSIATSKKVKEEWKSTWHKVVLLGYLAEKVAPMIKKGCQVFVSGEIQTREWQDQQGNKKSSVEILAREAHVLAEKPKAQDSDPTLGTGDFNDSDLPF